MSDFSVRKSTSLRGKRPSGCVEILERGPRGATLRVVARTPLKFAANSAALAELLEPAAQEALVMAAALNAAAQRQSPER